MMRFLIALAVLLAPLSAAADGPRPLPPQCGPAEAVLAAVRDKAGMAKRFVGGMPTDNNVAFVLMTNRNTGTWTLLTLNRVTRIACVVAGGTGGQVFNGDPV